MTSKQMIKYVIAIALSLFVAGAIGGVSKDLGFNIPMAVLIIIFLAGTVLMSFANFSVSEDLSKLNDKRAQDIAGNYNGKLQITDRIGDRNCYNISFVFEGREIEFIDTYRSERESGYPAQDELLIRTKISLPAEYILNFQQSTGSSFIGKAADGVNSAFLEMSGCRNIIDNSQLLAYKGLNIYSNQESKFVPFLCNDEVKQICLKYFKIYCHNYLSFPVVVEGGYAAIVFQARSSGANIDLNTEMPHFNEFLSDIIKLANKLETIS